MVKYSGLVIKKSKLVNEKVKILFAMFELIDKNLSFKDKKETVKNANKDIKPEPRTVTANKSCNNIDLPVTCFDKCKDFDQRPNKGVTKFNRLINGRCATNHSNK